MSQEGYLFFMMLILAYGIFGMVCSVTCGIFAIKNSSKTWHKIAGWVVIVNVALTIFGGVIAR